MIRIQSLIWVTVALGTLGIVGGLANGEEGIPADYKLVYEQSFDKLTALNDFRFSDPNAWQINPKGGSGHGGVLELQKQSNYKPTHRSPANLAILYNVPLSTFVLEADLLQTGRDYGHRDMCIYFGFTDTTKYYYSHIATKTDDHAHNIMIVNEKPRIKISTHTSAGVDWGKDQWHRVRLVRDADKGTIDVYYDDMAKPIMSASDKTFPKGYIGFGSFDDTGRVDNIKVWSPVPVKKDAMPMFATKILTPTEPEPDLESKEFRPLFDGKTLDGWRRADGKASGKMEYKVDGDSIAGTCIQGQYNGFLCTKKLYRDFIFTCEVKFDVLGNSGIQFRSLQRKNDGRVHGYQCEVDHSDRRYTGGMYDEANRKWLYPLWGETHAQARGAFKHGQWNRITIQARNRHVQTWVNGVACTDYLDTDPDHFIPEGFIALQVHQGKEGQIRWRKLKLRELDASPDASPPDRKP